MKVARLVVLGVAVVAGFFAWRLASNIGSDQSPVVVQQKVDTDEILVATKDIAPGATLSAADLTWESWPRDAINHAFVTRSGDPQAIDKTAGSVARTSFFSGEPIRDTKLVKSGAGGFLSAMLPTGMRAVATKTSPEVGAGGFILPNDHVDVVLTRQDMSANSGRDALISETVLQNVRVLAIDQTLEEKDGQMNVVGNVATLELRPEQVEVLALAQQLGDISLSLRSIMDGPGADAAPQTVNGLLGGRRGTVTVVKFGVPVQVNTN
ncbi:Flp pilus assembly protein CpaB [Microbaculum marinisediminis]|uniref:Flp pilus assembly protein CpaB n=1 Tax=Microbaculum marinisediminis TaxID=2931392 RepID=A0AAW5QVQ0_9HYPH|nr:Flp pilus assembly protein CpaB [Microbaculum sp. A6E488]MCT8972015.1 Flp pilus assembly protein CpaB [Microbaculum sp. A6E488]